MKYPTVTQILSATQPKEKIEGLNKWRQRVGEEEAEKVSQAAHERGIRLDAAISRAFKFAETDDNRVKCLIRKYKLVNEEIEVQSDKHKYRGRADGILTYRDNARSSFILVDYKGKSKPVNEKWIDEDYLCQIAAYFYAMHETSVTKPAYAVLMYFVDGLEYPQEFIITEIELSRHFSKFLKRLEQYEKGNQD